MAAPTTLVWDLPVRLFHGLLAGSFVGAWLTAESEKLHLLHVTLGTTMVGLVVFRLVWGMVGSRPARFASFVRGPRAVLAYLRSLRTRQPEHHASHNPAGALAVVGLLALTLATAALGWAGEVEWLPPALEDAHEAVATLMLVLVSGHVIGVILSSVLHRENLVRGMVTGRKVASPAEGIRRNHWPVALLLLAGVLGYWAWQWHSAPDGASAAALGALAAGDQDHNDDDD